MTCKSFVAKGDIMQQVLWSTDASMHKLRGHVMIVDNIFFGIGCHSQFIDKQRLIFSKHVFIYES